MAAINKKAKAAYQREWQAWMLPTLCKSTQEGCCNQKAEFFGYSWTERSMICP